MGYHFNYVEFNIQVPFRYNQAGLTKEFLQTEILLKAQGTPIKSVNVNTFRLYGGTDQVWDPPVEPGHGIPVIPGAPFLTIDLSANVQYGHDFSLSFRFNSITKDRNNKYKMDYSYIFSQRENWWEVLIDVATLGVLSIGETISSIEQQALKAVIEGMVGYIENTVAVLNRKLCEVINAFLGYPGEPPICEIKPYVELINYPQVTSGLSFLVRIWYIISPQIHIEDLVNRIENEINNFSIPGIAAKMKLIRIR